MNATNKASAATSGLIANLENTQRVCDSNRSARDQQRKQQIDERAKRSANIGIITCVVIAVILMLFVIMLDNEQYNAKIREIHSLPTTTVTVKSGDTLESIAGALDIDGISPTYLADEIRDMNQETLDESGLLHPGDKLIVPTNA